MEGTYRSNNTDGSPQSNKLNNLRSKYLQKMIHKNTVEQNHVRIVEKYKQDMQKRYQNDDLKFQSLMKIKETQMEKQKKIKHKQRQMKMKDIKHNKTTIDNVKSPRRSPIHERSINNSQTQIPRKSCESYKYRLNTIQFNKQQEQKKYSNHIMVQNLQRLDRYKYNVSMLNQNRQKSFDQLQKRRELTLQLNEKIRQQRQQKLISSLCNKIKYHDQLRENRTRKQKNQKKLLQNSFIQSQNKYQERLKAGRKQQKQNKLKLQSYSLQRQHKAQQLKQQNINRIKQRMNQLKMKQKRAKQNRQNMDKERQYIGQQMLKDHHLKSTAAKNLKQQLQKYKQQKLMIDFLSHDHTLKFNQSALN